MHKALIVLTVLSLSSGSAVAQTAPPPQVPQAQPVAPAKPQMVKKTVCTRVIEEETTGSRLGSAPKKCKTIEVPAAKGSSASGNQAPAPERSF